MFLVVDGDRLHKVYAVRELVEARGAAAVILPIAVPAAPHPDRQVWGNIKAYTTKQTATDKRDSQEQAVQALKRVRELPKVIAGFFRHPHCRYIRDAQPPS